MTRETKIGLLVGLAFIIVIGILLSDHLSVTAEPPQAALVQAGTSVREGIVVPGQSGAPVAAAPMSPVNVVPQAQVPIRQDLLPPAPRPEAIVSIQAGAQPTYQHQPPIAIHQHAPETPVQQGNYASPTPGYQLLPAEPVAIAPPSHHDVTLPGQSPMVAGAEPDVREVAQLTDPIARLAQQFGEQIVGVNDASTGRQQQQSQQVAQTPMQANTVDAKEYVAVDGDSLSKIAAKFYGRSTKESREWLVKANPSLKTDPNRIISGQKYLIPQKALTVTPAPQQQQQPAVVRTPANRGPQTVSYTVKDGDTLWGIAKNQCGGASALAALRELNKDVLKNGDTVVVGMNLRLPSRAVASAD